jgi:uncharacterized protein (DUF58 family)
MYTKKISSLAVTSVAFLLLGLYFRSWQLLVLIIPLVVVLTLTSFWMPSRKIDIIATRVVKTDRVREDDLIEVIIKLKNNGEKIDFLEVYDVLPETISLKKGTNHWISSLEDEIVINYKISCGVKGSYTIGPMYLRKRDLLGMFCKEECLEIFSDFMVIPKMEDIRRIKINPRRTREWLGSIQSRRLGIGTEFFSLRDYHPGDDIKKINWKASARSKEFITNEYEGERSGDAIIILDSRKDCEVGALQRTTIDHGVRAAMSLTSEILKNRDRVGLIVQRDVLDWVYPGFGRRQLYRIIDRLVKVKAGGIWSFEHITWVVSRFFPPESQIIIISPLIDFKGINTIVDLCAHGFDIIIVSPSPIAVEAEICPQNKIYDMASRVLLMERQNIISRLRRHARIVDWNPNDPLAVALKGVKRYPIRRVGI